MFKKNRKYQENPYDNFKSTDQKYVIFVENPVRVGVNAHSHLYLKDIDNITISNIIDLINKYHKSYLWISEKSKFELCTNKNEKPLDHNIHIKNLDWFDNKTIVYILIVH